MPDMTIESRSINTIRFLSADAVQKANSGHPGLPMGTAAMAYTIWARHLRFDPKDPNWVGRDRFVLSAGHGSMLLYSLLHLAGFDLSLQELKNFRQWGSKTPGHPEYGDTPGVEATTGPLGQGFAMGVGMALAAEHLAGVYNRPDYPLFEQNIYGIVSDGDLMEGVASEAASLAGHLKLGRLIYLYDDNRISIDGGTDLTFTENCGARFTAYGWHVSYVEDGNDVDALDEAIKVAKGDPRPSIIVCRTHIGYGLPTKQDTSAAHGAPPGEDELAAAKANLGWPQEPRFLIPDDVAEHFSRIAEKGIHAHQTWSIRFEGYRKDYAPLAEELERTLAKDLPEGYADALDVFPPDDKGMATRVSSGKVINMLAPIVPEMIGGSADLTGSNKTAIRDAVAFSADEPVGRYIHYGVREHAMGAMMNGIALHGGLIPYGGTFLVFSDYMRPAIRLAAMMQQRVIYVFSHDSIGLGEDGPTHQPIEHLAALRVIPNLTVLRPGDANEVAVAWQVALEQKTGPTALALTRQNVPTLDRSVYASAEGLRRGAYVLADLGQGEPQVILMGSGSEVDLALQAGLELAKAGKTARVVSFPSWELFEAQPAPYKQQVLPREIRARVAVEAGSPQGWQRWVGDAGVVLGMDHFGASAPYEQVYEKFGFTVDGVVAAALASLKQAAG